MKSEYIKIYIKILKGCKKLFTLCLNHTDYLCKADNNQIYFHFIIFENFQKNLSLLNNKLKFSLVLFRGVAAIFFENTVLFKTEAAKSFINFV